MASPATAAVRLLTGEREPVRLATTGPIDVDAGGLLTIDGVLTEVGDRVLVKDQTDGSENGIRTASEGQWYRASDSRTARTMQKGTTVRVQEGTANVDKVFVFNTLDPVVGDDEIEILPDTVSGVVPGATGLLLLAAATQAAAWGIVSSASAFAQTGTGSFSISQTPTPRIHKMADRLFLDKAVEFNGGFGASITGLDVDNLSLHNWGPRDASLYVDSSVAAMAIVGHSESKNYANWEGTPLPAVPSSIGVSGFSINNRVGGGQAWGAYFDCVRLTSGFSVGIEVEMSNFGSESTMTPFNVKSGGADGGVSVWAAIGGGLDFYVAGGGPPIKNIAAGYTLLSSFVDNSAKARSGFVIANGALVDRASGGLVYEAFSMPDRHQIAWYRASDQSQSAFIWADVITGSPVGLTFKTGGVDFTGGGTLVNNVFIGTNTTGLNPYVAAVGADTNIGLAHYTKGTGSHEFFTGTAKQFEVAHVATAVNYLQAKGAVTTGAPLVSAAGADTNIGVGYATKGTGAHSFYTSSTAKQFEVGHTANSVNYVQVAGSAAGGGLAVFTAMGADTNIALYYLAKGTASHVFRSGSAITFEHGAVASGVNNIFSSNAAAASNPLLVVVGSDTNISGILQGKGTGGWQFKDGATNKKFEYNTTGIGFFNATPVAKATVGAALSTGGAETNVNLATRINEIRTALINYGLAV